MRRGACLHPASHPDAYAGGNSDRYCSPLATFYGYRYPVPCAHEDPHGHPNGHRPHCN